MKQSHVAKSELTMHFEDLFAKSSLNILLGTFASKKTWLALDLAVCVANGKSWLGYPCSPTPALFIDFDHGPIELRRRVRSVLMANRSHPSIPFHYASLPKNILNGTEYIERLAAHIRSFQAGLVIFDSIDLSPSPWNRDGVRGWGHMPALINFVASTNTAILALAHTRKRRTNLGQMLIALGARNVLAVDSPFGESWLHLRTVARRSLQLSVSISAEIDLRQARIGKILHDATFNGLIPARPHIQPLIGGAGIDVLKFAAAHSKVTSAQILANIQSAVPGRLLHIIHELTLEGYLERVDPGGKGVQAIYMLAPAGASQILAWEVVK